MLDSLQKKEIKAPEKSITFQSTPDNNIQENNELLECITPNYLHEYTKDFLWDNFKSKRTLNLKRYSFTRL